MTTAIQTGMYRAASALGLAIGTPSTTWTRTAPAAGLGGTPQSLASVTGLVLQAKLGAQGQAAPGTPVERIAWCFLATAGDTLAAHQQISYGGYTFSVVGIATPGQGVYEVERV